MFEGLFSDTVGVLSAFTILFIVLMGAFLFFWAMRNSKDDA